MTMDLQPSRKKSAKERLDRELISVVQSHYEVLPYNPLICVLFSVDDFHRASQTFRKSDVYAIENRQPIQFAFNTGFDWGSEHGFRHVRFELAQSGGIQLANILKNTIESLIGTTGVSANNTNYDYRVPNHDSFAILLQHSINKQLARWHGDDELFFATRLNPSVRAAPYPITVSLPREHEEAFIGKYKGTYKIPERK